MTLSRRQSRAIRGTTAPGRTPRPDLAAGAYSYRPGAVGPLKLDDACVCGHARFTDHDTAGACRSCRCPAFALDPSLGGSTD